MRDARGRFLPGYDPGRHRLTRREKRRGYQTTLNGGRHGELTAKQVAWVYRKVRGYYRSREE